MKTTCVIIAIITIKIIKVVVSVNRTLYFSLTSKHCVKREVIKIKSHTHTHLVDQIVF